MQTLCLLLSVIATSVAGGSAASPSDTRRRVDLIELNHFVDDQGREVFRQLIFYDWSSEHHRYHVREWRLVKHASQLPQRRWSPAIHECTWHDDGQLRQVWSPSFRETWSQVDPERENRKLHPEEMRMPLWSPKAKSQSSDNVASVNAAN